MVNPLSRVGMKNIIKNNPIISPRNNIIKRSSNLDEREEKLILDIVKGEKEVVEGVNKNKTITLEEAAERLKNNF